MSDTSTEVLVERIDNFKEYMKNSVEVGFAGIHRRFDQNDKEHKIMGDGIKHTNGTVCEHTNEILIMKTEKETIITSIKLYFKILYGILCFTGIVISSLGIYFYKDLRNNISNEIDSKIKVSIEEFANKNFDEYNK